MKALPAALGGAASESVRGDLARVGAHVTLPPGQGSLWPTARSTGGWYSS
ncbi:hypothetical protein [Mycolicibacterium rhodesiae]|nr:hypothetical protein [Mycolicibacterium rhodesiae]MCV7348500.1 hypothetical protein [Mycolicibacterium rhodesiae]